METQSTVTSKTGVVKIGKPVSSELPKVKDSNVNLRDRLNDVLLTEKHNLVSYQIGINEVINTDLQNVITNNRNRLQNIHTNIFTQLFDLGEYQADVATSQQIADTSQVFTNYRTQFPYQKQ